MLPLYLLAIFVPLVVTLATDTTWRQPRPKPQKLSCDPDQPSCDCLCKCTQKKGGRKVKCDNKSLLYVPQDLPEDTVSLSLSVNRIQTIEKNAFVKLSELTFLKLTHNKIIALDDGAFNGLGKLIELRLEFNKRIALNSKILAPLKRLRTLRLSKSENALISSDAFLNTSLLESLDASYCGLRDISFLRSLRNSKLKEIVLNGNNVGNLTQNLFEGLTSGPKGLNLAMSDSGIRHIENATFASIKELTSLNLSYNDIAGSFPNALYGLYNLKTLRLSHVGLNNSVRWDVLRPNNTGNATLNELYLADNKMRKIEEGSFEGLGNLMILNLSGNPLPERISKGGFKGLGNLRELYLRDCSELTAFPKFASESENGSKSFTPKLKRLELSFSPVVTLRKIEVFRGLESLEFLDLSQTFVRGLILDSLKNLRTLRLRYSCLHELPHINSTVLKNLEISNNQFYLTKALHGNWTIPNLEVLDIHGNKFDDMTGQDTANFLSMFRNLKRLSMGKMGLFFLEGWIFDNLTKLERLELSFNALGNITARWFKNLKYLKKLEMRDCRIATVNVKSFPSEAFLNQLNSLDLRDNPFSCDCSIQWFLNWSKHHGNQLYMFNRKDYTCASPQWLHRMPLRKFTIPASCYKAYTLLTGLSVAGVAIIVCFFVGLAFFSRYRWHIKYKLFKLKIWFYGRQYEELDGSKYEFDYHVHYDDQDVSWVVNTLIPELEDKRGYRLYIKHRDSSLCQYIIENIRYSIEHSYKTVLCLSNQFTQNPGTQFLLSFIINKLVNEKKNILVCILLEEIQGENLLETLEEVLTEKSYIRLPEDRTEEAMEYFWSRVDEALHLPVITYRNISDQNAPDLPEERRALLQNVC
ncbi:insulin-like growth factor-binding protein complex acid labile subunit [Lineus longissimus]|uniref:insulin-like growth factor-binding protein complex acid labile subunit n=1 Tax=Lineus longissimus TaxID=88925 RepID=UPI002B4D0565